MLNTIILILTFLAVVFALGALIYAIAEWMDGEIDEDAEKPGD